MTFFKYFQLHTACPPDPDEPGEYWCSTKVTKSGKHVTGNWGFCSKGCPLEEGEYDYKPPEVDYGDYSDNDKSTGGRTEQILEAQSKFFMIFTIDTYGHKTLETKP